LTTNSFAWLDGWSSRIELLVSYSGTLGQYQVKYVVPYESGMQADFNDLRFTLPDDAFLDYWVESYVASSSATVWIKVPSFTTSMLMYMYYGNVSAPAVSNGFNTFTFFDDFSTPVQTTLAAVTEVLEDIPDRYNAMAHGDIDDDGTIEIVIVGKANTISIYHFDGSSLVLEGSATASYGTLEEVEIADIDDDGTMEIVTSGYAAGSISFIDVWTWNGLVAVKKYATHWTYEVNFSMNIADLDGDGKYEIIVDEWDATTIGCRVYNYNLTIYSEYMWAEVGGRGMSTPLGVGDVDGDGTIEFIISGHNASATYDAFAKVFHWSVSGGIVLEQTVTVDTGFDSEFRGSLVYDVDGDGDLEVVFIAYTKDAGGIWNAWLRIYSNNFTVVENDYKWQYEASSFACHLELFDYNNDGKIELSINGYVVNHKNFLIAFDWDGVTLTTLFEERVHIPCPGYTYNPSEQHNIADFDGDGKYEVVTVGYTQVASVKCYKSVVRYNGTVAAGKWFEEEGCWTTGAGVYSQSTTGTWIRNSADVDLTDVAFRVQEDPDDSDLMLFVRGTDANNNYAVQFSPDTNKIYWYRQTNGSFPSVLKQVVYNFGGYGPHILEIGIVGQTLSVFVDDVYIDQYTYIANLISSGRVGVITYDAYTFDYVAVRNYNSSEPALDTDRQSVRVSSVSALTDYQVRVMVPFLSGMQSDFDDVRFADSDGVTLLSYWREKYTASASALFWIKIPSIPIGSKTIYLYYNSPAAASASDGTSTFIFFDDFESGDFSKWDLAESRWTIESTIVKNGTHSAKCSVTTSDQLDRWLRKNMIAQDIKVGCWSRTNSGASSCGLGFQTIGNIILPYTTYIQSSYFGAGNLVGGFFYYWDIVYTQRFSDLSVPPGNISYLKDTWCFSEVAFDFGASKQRSRFDGHPTADIDLRDNHNNLLGIEHSLVGISTVGASIAPVDPTIFYVDDYFISKYSYPEPISYVETVESISGYNSSNRILMCDFHERYKIDPSGLILWLDQSDVRSYGDAGNWYDISGTGNKADQSVAIKQPSITGSINLAGTARKFDGINDAMEINNTILNGLTTGTIEFWLKLTTSLVAGGTTQCLYYKEATVNNNGDALVFIGADGTLSMYAPGVPKQLRLKLVGVMRFGGIL
jgi:hypothetical protein